MGVQKMQQLINLINQNQDLSNNSDGFVMILFTFAVLIAFGVLIGFISLITVIQGKNTLTNAKSKAWRAIAVTAFTIALVSGGLEDHRNYVVHNQIKANNTKIERIERTTINSQTSKYPYCVSVEHYGFSGTIQVLAFFNTQQNAINFIKKNQNSKHIFLPDYLESDSDSYLSQGSNKSIKNNFDQMQVKPTKRALTQVINESKNNK